MTFLLSILLQQALAAAPTAADVSKVDLLSLCLRDVARVCFSVQRQPPLEVRQGGAGYKAKKITVKEFESHVGTILSLVKERKATECGARLDLVVTVAGQELPGEICSADYSLKEWDRWLPYLR